MAPALVSSVISALATIVDRGYGPDGLKIMLMNLKALLACSRMLGDDDDDGLGWVKNVKERLLCSTVLGDEVDGSKSLGVASLLPRIQDAIGRIEIAGERIEDSVIELHMLAKEVEDRVAKQSSSCGRPPKVDKLDSVLYFTYEFLAFVCFNGEAMEALRVQITFLKEFLVFTKRTGVEGKQLENSLIQIRPFVISAAGVFIPDSPYFTFGEWVVQVESKCCTLLKSPTSIDPQVYRAYSQALCKSRFSSTKPQSSSLVSSRNDQIFVVLRKFLDSLISLFWDVLRHSVCTKEQFKMLYERLRLSRTILKQQHPKSDKFRDQIGGVICDAAIVLTSSLHQTPVDISYLLARFDVIQAHASKHNSSKPKELSFVGDSISHGIGKDIEAATSSHQPLHQTSHVVGFEVDEVALTVDRLTRGSKQLRIVPITGMAGLGKTTFALKVFNHPSVTHHFHVQAWCPISQVFDKRRVFLQLLNHIQPGSSTRDKTVDDLASIFCKSLKGKRYLIFLDDVWTSDVWDKLEQAFPDDSTGSRVIFTSRHRHIAPCDLTIDGESHLLRLRRAKECLEIMQAKLFPGMDWPLELIELGMKFAEWCKGLPLTAVIMAGILATTEQKYWNRILESLSSDGLSGEEQVHSVLELSYQQLPDDLKHCFLYFGAFPEDEVISVKRLIRIWMAEGFVPKQESKRIEDVALEYMERLIEMSLVMVAKIRSIGGVKTCRIHDVLHEFCRAKAKQENFFHLLQQSRDQLSDFNEPSSLQRLCIHSDPLHFQESRLFCPGAHSLLLFSDTGFNYGVKRLFHLSFIIQILKLLKVLDMGQMRLHTEIPSEIEFLTQLTYLSIMSFWPVIPSSIGNLSNLETFIADFGSSDATPLPCTLWNLHKLKYLCIVCSGGFSLPTENLENSYMLLELETLSGVEFRSHGSMERQIRKFPNLRRLRCRIPNLNKNVTIPGILGHLEYLTITGYGKPQFEFGSAENLKKVTLKGMELSREEIAIIGKLPNLEVLKLEEISGMGGGTLQMEEGEFMKLRILKVKNFYYPRLERWIATGEEQLPCLQKLVFVTCWGLEEIPSCLETSSTLEEIEVYYCSPALERLVRDIQEVQKDCGYLIKVRMQMGVSFLQSRGFGNLYKGFSAGLLRKLSYASFLGYSSSSFSAVSSTGNARKNDIISLTAAFSPSTVAAFVLNPLDVAATRM